MLFELFIFVTFILLMISVFKPWKKEKVSLPPRIVEWLEFENEWRLYWDGRILSPYAKTLYDIYPDNFHFFANCPSNGKRIEITHFSDNNFEVEFVSIVGEQEIVCKSFVDFNDLKAATHTLCPLALTWLAGQGKLELLVDGEVVECIQ